MVEVGRARVPQHRKDERQVGPDVVGRERADPDPGSEDRREGRPAGRDEGVYAGATESVTEQREGYWVVSRIP